MLAIDARMFCHPVRTSFGQIVIRPIEPTDADMVQAFVRDLSGASRYFRFFQPLKCLPPGMIERFIRVDGPAHVALVALAPMQGKECLVGEARYCGIGDGATAELAIVVADEWQRRGVGTALLQILEGVAAANGITQLTGEALARNDTFASFVRASGFRTWQDRDPAYLRFEKNIGANRLPVILGP
jgi:acetyltransferase